MQVPSIDFLIITALTEEREAMLALLPGWKRLPPSTEDVFIYYEAVLPLADMSVQEAYRLVITSPAGMGRVNAASLSGAAIRRWQPRHVLLVGIAGGFAVRGVSLGDVLISQEVLDYELQKIMADGPSIRAQVHQAGTQLLVAAEHLSPKWWQDLRIAPPAPSKPAVHIGVVATGDKVVADERYQVVQRLLTDWPKLLGVEMEAGGVASAAFQQPQPPGFFMVRGVSDLADAEKDYPSTSEWRAYACHVAAAYTCALLRSYPVPVLPPIPLPVAPTARSAAREEGSLQLLVPREEATRELEGQIARGRSFLEREITDNASLQTLKEEYFAWDEYNLTLLSVHFTNNSLVNEYKSLHEMGSISILALDSSNRLTNGSIKRHILKRELHQLQRDINRLLSILVSVKMRVEKLLLEHPMVRR